MEKIASFKVNHLKLNRGLYVSRKDVYNNVTVTTFDLRFTVPNKTEPIPNPALHTIEHLFATFLRNGEMKDKIVYFGPMGCRTGFYLILFGDLYPQDVYDMVIQACDFVLEFSGEIPGNKPEECGNYLEHDLHVAKSAIKTYKNDLINYKNFQYE